MKYKVKKDSHLYSCLNNEQKELRYDIVRRCSTPSGKTTYYKISALMNDGTIYEENALPKELEEVDLTFEEQVEKQILEPINKTFK